mgnify:CR=1 FL=1
MSSEFQLGPWVVRPSQNVISCNGKTTRLEPKMVEVLVCLAEHAGETVSKDQLHQRVWGDTFVTDDVLTRCISELRRVLEDNPKEPHVIQTIPRKGYRLVPQVGPVKKKARRQYVIGALVALAMLGVAIGYGLFRHPPSSIHSLAVLPLKNLSGRPGQQFCVSALPDELDVEIENDCPALHISGENLYVSLILQNLLENARKYNRPGGRIRISCHEGGDRALLTIGNTGRPIPAAAPVTNAVRWAMIRPLVGLFRGAPYPDPAAPKPGEGGTGLKSARALRGQSPQMPETNRAMRANVSAEPGRAATAGSWVRPWVHAAGAPPSPTTPRPRVAGSR